MSDKIIPFRGTGRNDRLVFTCDNCGATTFKIVKRGASEMPFVECANCECAMTEVLVDV
jgi:hypothetical protein